MMSFADNTDEKIALEKYMEWLNLWIDHTNQENPGWQISKLTLEDFFKYDETSFLAALDLPRHYGERKLLIIQAGYGDEGGSSTIYAYFRDVELDTLIQEFDTMWSIIWTEGKFRATPEKVLTR